MASRLKSLDRVLAKMAKGSQCNSETLIDMVISSQGVLKGVETAFNNTKVLAALQPRVRDLLQAAGWLFCCFSDRSQSEGMQALARGACTAFLEMASNVLIQFPPTDFMAVQQLLEPRSRPQVPGEQ
jgi:hypothetical protein